MVLLAVNFSVGII